MPRVLILGLYYPPANFSAARRLEGWSRHLPAFGYEPLVLTRYYDPEERNTGDFYASSRPTRTLKEPWIESDHVVYTSFIRSAWSKLPMPGKMRGLGHFAWPDPDHSGWLRQCSHYLESSKFKPDLIIASFSPAGVFRIARKLSKRFSVPWIADFRDLWLHDLDDSFSSRLKLSLQRRHLRSAAGVTVVTEGTIQIMRGQLAPLDKPIRAIYNGAEPVAEVLPDKSDVAALDEFQRIQSSYSIVLTHPGTLYPEQRVETHLNTVARFNESGRGSCAVVLFGRHDRATYEKWPFVKALGFVSHQSSLFLQRNSTALFYPTWPASQSVYSGKIFELVVSRRPVLVGFTPSPDLESLCRHFSAVRVLKSPDEMIYALDELQSSIAEKGVQAVPSIATKKYWTGQLARLFDEILQRNR